MKRRTREWLIQARIEANITIRELAELSDVSMTAVQKVISGERAGGVAFGQKIESVLDNYTETLKLKRRDGSIV